MEVSSASKDLQTRLNILITDLTINFYKNICRGLFEKDKLLYSFLITVKILLNEGEILMRDWNFFLRGTAVEPEENAFIKPEFITDL